MSRRPRPPSPTSSSPLASITTPTSSPSPDSQQQRHHSKTRSQPLPPPPTDQSSPPTERRRGGATSTTTINRPPTSSPLDRRIARRLPQAHIIDQPVLWNGGMTFKTRQILEPITSTSTSTSSDGVTTSSVTPRTDLPAYVVSHSLSRCLAQGSSSSSKSVALLLATQARRCEQGPTPPHFIRVGPLVAIKVSPLDPPDDRRLTTEEEEEKQLHADHSGSSSSSSGSSISAVVATTDHQPLREVAALQLLADYNPGAHHVTPLLHAWQDGEHVYTVQPFLSGGDLYTRVLAAAQQQQQQHTTGVVVGCGGLPLGEATSYLRHMAEGLLFMKQAGGLAHRDVCLENVMLDGSGGVASFIELGLAVRVQPPSKTTGPAGEDILGPAPGEVVKDHRGRRRLLVRPLRCVGNPQYVSPEVARLDAYDPFAADMWSLGCCLYTMLTGTLLYNSPTDTVFGLLAEGRTEDVLLAAVAQGVFLPLAALDLLCLMLHPDPVKRPTLTQLLQHRFLTENGLAKSASSSSLTDKPPSAPRGDPSPCPSPPKPRVGHVSKSLNKVMQFARLLGRRVNTTQTRQEEEEARQ